MDEDISHIIKINAVVYKALLEGDDAKVFDECRELPDGPLHVLTIHGETVIYTAAYQKRNKLVLDLLSLLPEGESDKLTMKNNSGNTILHATASNNKTVEAATEMLRRAPSLLTMADKRGETPFFRAAGHGKTQSFHFFKNEVRRRFPEEADRRTFLVRDDKTTILHAAIHSENFDLARDIAQTDQILIGEEDGDGMTGLQLLACKPSAFKLGIEDNFFKRFICKFIDDLKPGQRFSRVPIVKEVQKQKLKSESAKQLASLLVEFDASWEATKSISNKNRIKYHKFRGDGRASTSQRSMSAAKDPVNIASNAPSPDSPLFLATKSGCIEIVKEILQVYPQAVEHIDDDGRGILHVAIKYRRMEIYDAVIDMKYPLTRLRKKIDKKGNSILHMVAMKNKDQRAEGDIRSPAIVLRDDLLLFEKVESICTTLGILQVNDKRVTAKQLFIQNNATLHIEAKEWMKMTSQNCSIVAVLIATVAFAAAYTVPGGPDQSTGYPLLKSKPFFIVFALADALSLTFSLTSVIIFLSILTSSFRLNDFKNSLHNKLLLGLTVLILSVAMMMVAFAATLILTISSKQDWTNIMLYTIAFFPVTVFVCSYVNLYGLLLEAFGERLKKIITSILPERDVESAQAMQQPKHPSQAPPMSSFV